MEKQNLKEILVSEGLIETLSFLVRNFGNNDSYFQEIVRLSNQEQELRRNIWERRISQNEAIIRKNMILQETIKLIGTIQANEISDNPYLQENLRAEFEFNKREKLKNQLLEAESTEELRIIRELLFNKNILEASIVVLLNRKPGLQNASIENSTIFKKITSKNRFVIKLFLVFLIISCIYILIDFGIKVTTGVEEGQISSQMVLMIPLVIFLSIIGLVSLSEVKSLREVKDSTIEYFDNLENQAMLLHEKFEKIYPFVKDELFKKNG